MAEGDFYETLGISFEATESEIKKAYRRLSLKYHPDKNPNDDTANDMFQKVARAYEVLSNPDKRQTYDLEGEEGLEAEEKNAGRPSSPFDAFFGGGGGGKPHGPDMSVNVQVTLEELYNGAQKQSKFQKQKICPKCRGTGAKDGKMTTCPKCKGQGVVYVLQRMGGFTVQVQQTCDHCGGTGKHFKEKCPHCHGHKVVVENKLLEADIEPGMPSDHRIVFERESHQQPGTIPGDVVFQLRLQKHDRFRRTGNDLHLVQKISLEEALLGFQTSIKRLDDRMIPYTVDEITQPYQVRTIKNEGMPIHNFPSEHGDLFVENKIKYPKVLTEAQKDLVKKLLP